MSPTVYLAAEDEPGLAVGRKLIAEAPPLCIYREDNGHGYGTLKVKTPNFDQMGVHFPVLMITDLDSHICPSALIDEWLGRAPSRGFLFRICVREVEAWILAHQDAIAEYLHVQTRRIPLHPESLPDPKKSIIEIAKVSSNREIRRGFQPIGSAVIGPEYNSLLTKFVEEKWNPQVAADKAPSLRRARTRIQTLAASITLAP